MRVIFVKPNPDKQVDGQPIRVQDPVRRAWLPAEGSNVQETAYWLRRLADKDVVLADATAPVTKVDPSPALAPEALLGSSSLPAIIEIGTEQVQLGTIVAAAHQRSGKTAKQWNKLADKTREKLLADEIEIMRAAVAPNTEA